MALSFVALDFETANSFRASACSLGMTKVVNGEIVASKYEIFRPPKNFDHFDARNIAIHKIHPEQVVGMPRFGEFWPSFKDFIGDLPLVAHNASFDLSVLRAALQESEIDWPEFDYACTWVMSRQMFELMSHSLLYVAHKANVVSDPNQHHDALYDSQICAEIAISMSKSMNVDNLEEMLKKLNLQMGHLFPQGWYTCRSRSHASGNRHSPSEIRLKASEVQINQEADNSHPFFGKIVVFTGKLYSMPRPEAWQLVASVGAIPKDSMSKSTNVLVVGEQDPMKMSPGETQSAKFREAEKLKLSGADIEVINETDFLAFLEPESGTAS
jgi:DNA polymerase-3 subunit epsilon